MSTQHRHPPPLAHVGSVNAGLLPGDPLGLADTGPRDDAAPAAPEAGLWAEGLRIEDIALVLLTYHHIHHVRLAAPIQRRSGAVIAALDGLADCAERFGAELERRDRRFARAPMAQHGVPERIVAASEDFWAYLCSRLRYLDSLRRTARMPQTRLLAGHGAPVTRHGRLLRAGFLEHERRCERSMAILAGGPATAYGMARRLWSARTVVEQPLLVVWEVLGHLELLLAAGHVAERASAAGSIFKQTPPGGGPGRPEG